ncbi:hypothetical protein [Enhydrobacter aerosaccus]|nr:hypothetical protein [Enhydrobacter aerosaccus]
MAAPESLQARYGKFHNLSMALVAVAMVAAAVLHFATHPANAPSPSLADPRTVLFAVLAVAMLYYAYIGISHALDREPQVVIDRNGIQLGFGRNRRLGWSDVQWVRLRRLALRPQLQIGLLPEAFVAADLRLSMWSLDDGLRPIRGVPAGVLVRDNGLDTSASAMLDAVRRFRPNLVKS